MSISDAAGRYDADAIKANCFAKLFFTGQSLETTKELEQTLGKFEFEDKDGKKVIRSLMTNDEIRMMKTSRALLICGHHKPILVHLKPFYKTTRLREFSGIEIPNISGEINSGSLSVLPLPQSKHETEEV